MFLFLFFLALLCQNQDLGLFEVNKIVLQLDFVTMCASISIYITLVLLDSNSIMFSVSK